MTSFRLCLMMYISLIKSMKTYRLCGMGNITPRTQQQPELYQQCGTKFGAPTSGQGITDKDALIATTKWTVNVNF